MEPRPERPLRPIVTSLLVLALASAFLGFFQLVKHEPHLAEISPFGEDPYDAIGSFGALLAFAAALLSLGRALVAAFVEPPTPIRRLFLIRGQVMAVLAVCITVVFDLAAMLRFPSWWDGTASRPLLALVVGMAAFAALVGLVVERDARQVRAPRPPGALSRTLVVTGIGVVLIVALPASIHTTAAGGFVALAAGTVVFFALVRIWTLVGLPYTEAENEAGRRYWPGRALIAGLLFGVAISQIEGFAEGFAGLTVVALVFVVIGTVSVCVGYAFVARPLGLYFFRVANTA